MNVYNRVNSGINALQHCEWFTTCRGRQIAQWVHNHVFPEVVKTSSFCLHSKIIKTSSFEYSKICVTQFFFFFFS